MSTEWKIEGINIFMDMSTFCNAGCPQCHRTNPDGLGKVDWLPLVQWSIEQFKTAFPLETLEYINRFHFCGTFGDPIMVKDILEIIEYVIDNSKADIIIDTNGSLRNEDFWWDLGVIGGSRLLVKFDVDGIDQEMHSHYRRFTELDKVLNHMSVISQTKCHVHSQTILFKHNENYIKEITQLCRENGASYSGFTVSNRFDFGPVTEHTDENGNSFTLEEVSKEKPYRKPGPEAKKIVCQWAQPKNEVVVSYDGQVLPCCYHQNPYHRKFRGLLKSIDGSKNSSLYSEYEEDKLKLNILHTPLKDIIESKWYSKTLPDSIENKPLEICTTICSKRCS